MAMSRHSAAIQLGCRIDRVAFTRTHLHAFASRCFVGASRVFRPPCDGPIALRGAGMSMANGNASQNIRSNCRPRAEVDISGDFQNGIISRKLRFRGGRFSQTLDYTLRQRVDGHYT